MVVVVVISPILLGKYEDRAVFLLLLLIFFNSHLMCTKTYTRHFIISGDMN